MDKKYIALNIIIIMSTAFTFSFIVISFSNEYPERYYPVPHGGDISFWNDIKLWNWIENDSTLDVEIVWERNVSFMNTTIFERQIFYTSEIIHGKPLRINAIFMRPADKKPIPVIVFQHGYAQSWASFYSFFKYIVYKSGFGVFAIDAPDCGNSSTLVKKDPKSLLNVSDGPYGSYIFHEALAIMRGITYLITLEEVDSGRILMSGVSMGGINTFIITAIDNRIIAGAPIIAAGNFLNTIAMPRLSNGLAIANEDEKEKIMENFIKWYDLVHYARAITKPIIYMVTTNDEFFDLVSYNDTFNAIKSKEKYFVVFPNSGHEGIPWALNAINNLIKWAKHVFEGNRYLNISEYSFISRDSLFYTSIRITARADVDAGQKVVVYYRLGIPLSDWILVSPSRTNGNIFYWNIPIWSAKSATFYVAILDESGDVLATTPIVKFKTNMSIVFILFVAFLFIALVINQRIILLKIWSDPKDIIPSILYFMAYLLLFTAPIFTIFDRGQWSIWDVLEVYKIILGISYITFYIVLFTIAVSLIALIYAKKIFHTMYLALIIPISLLIILFIGIEVFAYGWYLSWNELPIFFGWGLLVSTILYVTAIIYGRIRS